MRRLPKHELVLAGGLTALLAGIMVFVVVAAPFGARAADTATDSASIVAASRQITQGAEQAQLAGEASPGALEFPAGVSYPEALVLIMRANVSAVALAGVAPTASLPAGVVALIPPASSGGRVVVDMRAPFGYSPAVENRVFGPVYQVPSDIATDGAFQTTTGGWPKGALLAIPSLPGCMVISAREQTPKACTAGDEPILGRTPSLPLS